MQLIVSIITMVENRIAVDAAQVDVMHVQKDKDGNYLSTIESDLNYALTVSANIDQTGRQLIQDIVQSMCDEGVVAVVPVDTNVNPYDTTELKNIIDEVAHDMIFDAYHNFDRTYRQEKLEEAKKLVKERVEALHDDHYIKQII